MVKKHVFCNNMYADLEIRQSLCNYRKAILNKRLSRNYIFITYDDLNDTQKDYVLKLPNKAKTVADGLRKDVAVYSCSCSRYQIGHYHRSCPFQRVINYPPTVHKYGR